MSKTQPHAFVVLLTLMTGCSSGTGSPDVVDQHSAADLPGDTSEDVSARVPDGRDSDIPGSDLANLDVDVADQAEQPDMPPPEGPSEVDLFGLFEASLDMYLEATNPFDPEEIVVEAEFRPPQGEVRVGSGFWFQDFDREVVEGVEHLSAKGTPHWRVRFTPNLAGAWSWRWLVHFDGEKHVSPWRDFNVTSSPAGKGFLRRAQAPSSRHLVFDNSDSFLAIGENMGWYDSRGTAAYDDWLSDLAEVRGNYVRLWMASWGFSIEWSDGVCNNSECSQLGNYTSRLDRAWQLDYVFGRAEELGIYVMLCMLNHGPFSLASNSEWDFNPYNIVNGGFLDKPKDFFTDKNARKLTRQRFRYIVARYGWSTHLLAWELFNEVDLTQQQDPEILETWHREMAGFIKSADPFGHLVTTSTTSLGALIGLDAAVFSLTDIDLVQFHMYGREGFSIDFAKAIPEFVRVNLSFEKPVLAGEVGVDFAGPAESLERDPNFVGFHDILWIPIAAGAWGTGMNWWWDNLVEPNNLYHQFEPVAEWIQGIDFSGGDWQEIDAVVSGVGSIVVLGQKSETAALLWIKNINNHYFMALDDSMIMNATVTLEKMTPGQWKVVWVEPWGGNAPPVGVLSVGSNGSGELQVPTFRRDVAARLVLEP